MNNYELEQEVDNVTGSLIGHNLLDEFKRLLISDAVLKKIFLEDGKRIFINERAAYSENLLPVMELWWENERQESTNTYINGVVSGRIILPKQVKGKLILQRQLMRAIVRFMGSDHFHEIFTTVKGLTQMGVGLSADYNKIIKVGSFECPLITFKLPYQFDVHLFERETPEIDHDNYLDSEEFEDFLTTIIEVKDDSTGDDVVTFEDEIEQED